MQKNGFWIELALQAILFYGLPLLAGPTDAMGIVLLLLMGTLGLSCAVGYAMGKMWFLYPAAVSVIFIPSVWMYYNDSALIHALWYLVTSALGVGAGRLLRGIGQWIQGRKEQ